MFRIFSKRCLLLNGQMFQAYCGPFAGLYRDPAGLFHASGTAKEEVGKGRTAVTSAEVSLNEPRSREPCSKLAATRRFLPHSGRSSQGLIGGFSLEGRHGHWYGRMDTSSLCF